MYDVFISIYVVKKNRKFNSFAKGVLDSSLSHNVFPVHATNMKYLKIRISTHCITNYHLNFKATIVDCKRSHLESNAGWVLIHRDVYIQEPIVM